MILIVDDKQENIFSLKRILELNGFEVDTADSGEEALKKILKQSYALIVLDVQMPGMDGFEVADAISGYSKAKDIPILFLSAVNTDKRFIAKGYDSGGIDYITKPVDPDILILKVRTFCRLYEQTKALNDTQKALRDEIETRKHAEEALTLKVKEQQTILESIPQIAFMASTSGHIEFVNDHWYLYASNKEQLPQSHPDDESLRNRVDNAIATGKPFVAEVRIKQLQAQGYRYYLLKMTPVIQNGKPVKWVGTFTDIHEQKSANEILEQHVAERTRELLNTNKELEATNYDLQQFASVASHDLKEPLRKIQVFSSIIKEKYAGQKTEGLDTYVQRIIESSERMSGLITDLLSYSRLSAHELFRPTDLNTVVNHILQDLEVTIKEKRAAIHTDGLPVLEVIPGQMNQVFQNIISNALKFSQKDQHPEITIKAVRIAEKQIDSRVDEKGNYFRIEINDNGIGFNEKYLDKIFTIFQRLNARDTYEGTGIGLAIAKRIIEKHHGLITARSKENEGATFIIVLPIKQMHVVTGEESTSISKQYS